MIEVVSTKNIEDVLPLIEQYQRFYQAEKISTEKNREFFSQFGEASPFGCQFVFYESDKAVGFATVYFSFASTLAAKVAVLSDLYTAPDYRGKGIGRSLIEHCHDYVISKGAERLQWVTAPSNTAAQALYDAMNTNKSSWYFYSYNR